MISMNTISREYLHSYLDEALSPTEMAHVEQMLRESPETQALLRQVLAERDRGEHSLGAIWRRERLTCMDREKLGSYLLGVLDPEEEDYIRFHLEVLACPYCLANFTDLREQQARLRARR
jgi:anti-sigma factor RsiW